jgi:hypothetical protein
MCNPLALAVVASAAYAGNRVNAASKDANATAAQQAQLQQEAEERRIIEQRQIEQARLAEERAAAERTLAETRTFQQEQLDLQRQMQMQAELAAAEQIKVQERAFAQQQAAVEAEAARRRASEEARQNNILQGQQEISSVFGQFDDNFFNSRAKSYTDYALPQLDTQYQDTLRNLTASLARSGNLSSSLRGETFAKAQREYDTQKLALADRGQQYANDARSAIERARSELFSTNASLADPGSIRTLAQQRAQAAVPSQSFSPLATMLTDLASTVAPAGKAVAGKAAQGVNLFSDSMSGGTGRVVG